MKRRSDATMTILAMGLVSIALFGGVIVYYSQQTPILRLRPELEAKFKVAPFDTRFIAGVDGNYPHIEITPPEALAMPDDYARAAVGAWALDRYVELTEQRTSVSTCWVRTPGDAWPPLVVDTEMASNLSRALEGRPQMTETALKQGMLEPVEIVVKGVVQTGVHVRVIGRAAQGLSDEQRQKVAAKAAEALANFSYLSKVELELEAPGGGRAKVEAGRDVPKVPKKQPPRR